MIYWGKSLKLSRTYSIIIVPKFIWQQPTNQPQGIAIFNVELTVLRRDGDEAGKAFLCKVKEQVPELYGDFIAIMEDYAKRR
jgi:hypothetical protein